MKKHNALLKYVFTMSFLTICFIHAAHAADVDYPTTGVVFNVVEESFINYDCTQVDKRNISCELVQVRIAKKNLDQTLAEEIEEAKKQFPLETKKIESDGACQFIGPYRDFVEGKTSVDDFARKMKIEDDLRLSDLKRIKAMSLARRAGILDGLEEMKKMCDNNTEDQFMGFIEKQYRNKERTCNVSLHKSELSFSWVGSKAEGGAWVVKPEALGECGIVLLDRFETVNAAGNSKFWVYRARKAVTNPSGKMHVGVNGMKCEDFDEKEYLYDWRIPEVSKKDCTYIEFSPF